MYNVKLSKDELDSLRRGNRELLIAKLEQSNELVVRDLKKAKGDNVSFLQGSSHVIDRLLDILKVPSK